MSRAPLAYLSAATLALALGCAPQTPVLPGFDAGTDAGGTSECPFPYSVCSGACVNTNTDGNNCGACGTQCVDSVCNNGTCEASCGTLTLCGTDCVDVNSDVANCGSCGNTCAVDEGQTCVARVCSCADGLDTCGDDCVDLDTDPENCGICGRTADVAGGEACVSGNVVPTREVACNDEADDDNDDLVDCADSDCEGARRDCDCENGVETSYEVCQADGTWGECQGCAPPAECSTDAECVAAEGYGWGCNSTGQCEFDWNTTFDVFVCNGNWPDPSPISVADESDPDVFWLIRAGESGETWYMSSQLDDQSTRSATWNETVVFSATAETLRRSFYVQLWDADFWSSDDLIGSCNISNGSLYGIDFTTSDFDGTGHVYRCEPRTDNAGYNVRIALVEPGMGTSLSACP